MSLKVNEIFYSIQGESTYAGRPCCFVRLTGCNLRCSYCDTQYAYEEGEDLELDEIVMRVASRRCRLVEVTGGVPLIQRDTPLLIHSLLEDGYEVLLETNGTQDVQWIDKRCVKILDVKCPSSGEADKNDLENLEKLTEKDEVKFVIGDRADYEYAREVLTLAESVARGKNPVLLSPVFGRQDPGELAGWILDDHLNVRLHLQLHKIIWGPERTGV